MKERIGIIFGCAILLAACESGDDLANSSQPPSDVQSVEVSTVTEPQAIAPPPVLSNPVNPQAVDPQPTTPSAAQSGNSDQVSTPDPAQPEIGVQPTEAEPPVTGAIPVVVSVPPPQPVEEEIEAPPVDSTPPETVISSQPSAVSNKTSASFEFSCSDPVAAPFAGASSDAGVKPAPTCTFFCQLDVGTPASCVSPITLSPVTDGSHTFTVYAVDQAGNRDATPASHTWTVDTTGPAAPTISSATSGNREVSLTWSPAGSETAVEFDIAYCAPAGECTPPSTPQITRVKETAAAVGGLANCTAYEFFVRGRDNLQNTGAWSTATVSTPVLPAPGAPTVVEHPWQLQLAWSAVANAESYVIYHAASTFNVKTSAAAVRATGTAWEVNFPDSAKRYIRLAAREGDCESSLSPEVFSNPLGSSSVALLTIAGEVKDDNLGASVSWMGDVNGDRKDDVIVGAPNADSDPMACWTPAWNRGVVRIYSGATGAILRRFCGDTEREGFGTSVSSAGDVDGDGKGDVIVGAPKADSDPMACPEPLLDRGIVRVYSGATGNILRRFCGDAAGDGLGASVSLVRNVDWDGKDGIMAGAPSAGSDRVACSARVDGRGIVRVYSASTGVILRRFCGDAADDNFGTAISSIGDADGDGKSDVVVGAEGADADPVACPTAAKDRGIARVYSGSSGVVLHRYCGDAVGDRFGASVSGGVHSLCRGRQQPSAICGDLDADDRPEVVIGARLADEVGENTGRAYIFRLSDGIAPPLPMAVGATPIFLAPVSPATAPYSWTIVKNNSAAATVTGTGSVATYIAGPVVAVSDTIRLTDSKNRTFDTRVGTVSWPLVGGFGWPKTGGATGDQFGASVAPAGDVDGDGRDDVIVGAPYADSDPTACTTELADRGVVRIYSGSSGAILRRLCGTKADDHFGALVSTAGDVNGDGKDDVIVGAPKADFDPAGCPTELADRGIVRVYSGADGSILHSFCGDMAYRQLGTVASSAGDVNRDGKDDVIVGLPGEDSDYFACRTAQPRRGVVRVYSGADGTVLLRFCGDSENSFFGSSVSAAGDVNGDGRDDVVVGAPYADSDPTACPAQRWDVGIARVYSGANGAVLHRWCGDAERDGFGTAVSSAGDVNGDGKGDVVVGASRADSDPTTCPAPLDGRGIVRVYSGSSGAILHRFCGEESGDKFGRSVSSAGDVNGDRRPDLIAGAPFADTLNDNAGKAYLLVSRQPSAAIDPPSDLAVGTTTPTSVALSWRDNSSIETGFCVEFRRPTFAWITASCFVPANASTYTVTGLSPKTRYHFRVKSFNASSDSLWSNVVTATTNP